VQEWLVRVMCFALGLNPMPFVRMMNKGQEETHHSEAKEEGLRPWLEWVANFVNVLIALKWGRRDVIFRWTEEDDTDPKTMAEIDQILISTGMYLPDERRVARGDAPMDAGKRKQLEEKEVAAATAIAEVKAGSKAKENEGKPTAKEKAAEKAEWATLFKSLTASAPAINVAGPTINMPAIKVDAPAVHVAPPVVNMGDHFIDVAAPIMRIAAHMPEQPPAAVHAHFEAQMPEPAAVTVNVQNNMPPAEISLKLPARKTETDVRRDADGNIVHATQTETDA